jgi:type IV secretion system protein VirB10
MYVRSALMTLAAVAALSAQQQAPAPESPASESVSAPAPAAASAPATTAPAATTPASRTDAAAKPDDFVVAVGTRIPLSMINSISTKTAAEGERVYLETVFPILVSSHVVIPPGSYVSGTVTEVKRPGRVKGRGELYVRFDALTLPNGVTRDFRARVASLDGRAPETLDKSEGKIKGEGDKAGDVKTVGEAAGAAATIGGLAGAAAGHAGMGAGLGAAAGATAGLMYVLLSRGPDAVLAKGTTLEMVLDRPLEFTTADIDFRNSMPRANSSDGPGPQPSRKLGSPRPWPIL